MNQKTHQTNLMALGDPLDIPVIPQDPLNVPLSPLGPLNMPLDPTGPSTLKGPFINLTSCFNMLNFVIIRGVVTGKFHFGRRGLETLKTSKIVPKNRF